MVDPPWVDVFGLDCATTNYDIPYTAKGLASIFAGWGAALTMEAAGSWIAVRGATAARARIAGLAAGRATREEIAEMERILEEQHKEVLQRRTGVVQDTALHSAIAHRADNRAITRIVSALMDLLTLSREESLHTPGRPTRSHADQRRILEAIQRRDEGAAHRSMLDHLIAVETLVTSALGLDRRDAPAHREKRSAKS